MSKIVYLGHYCDLASSRKNSPAAVNVMSYVIDSVNKLGYEITVVSPVQKKDGDVCCREMQRINEKTVCIYTPALKKPARWNIPYRAIQKWRREWNLRRELARTVEDGDTLLVYHSLGLMDAVQWIRRRRNIQLILQVGEIYSDVLCNISGSKRLKEQMYISEADSYIFMSEMLAEQFSGNKAYAVCLGICKCEKTSTDVFAWNDGLIHVVYSGTLDPEKGCLTVVKAGAFLSSRYHLHILAFGSDEQVKEMKQTVSEISEKSEAKITYEGTLFGEQYEAFMRKCHIGLSPQNPKASFNATSFPSKILNYMSMGLQVVSIRLPTIEKSAVHPYIHYYDVQKPEWLADAIMSVELCQQHDPSGIVRKLDREFREDLKKLLAPFAADGQDENNESI